MDGSRRAVDAIIIGGGPAGLTAAIYLARFHLSVSVFDDGQSRAALIPLTRNHAGHPGGIAGVDLLRRMRAQATGFGAALLAERVADVAPEGGGFRVTARSGDYSCAKLLLATGVSNRGPAMPAEAHDEALGRGLIRYCPVCDGYEVTDLKVALLGSGEHGLAEAEFMRSYTRRVSLVAPQGPHRLDDGQRARLRRWGITAIDGPVRAIIPLERQILLRVAGAELGFDTLYPALGTEMRSELARAAGAATAKDGAVLVDRHQMTSLPGLYAAGDVVRGLDQIATAMGQAAVAATAMRNALCEARPLRR